MSYLFSTISKISYFKILLKLVIIKVIFIKDV
jgi:hypothetical protein